MLINCKFSVCFINHDLKDDDIKDLGTLWKYMQILDPLGINPLIGNSLDAITFLKGFSEDVNKLLIN